MDNIQLKNQKGLAAQDALIAVLIIALFAGLIATISYNIYLSSSSTKRMSKATGYIIDMFEYIDKTYYDDITKDSLSDYFNKKYYYEEDGNTPKADAEVKLIKTNENTNTPFTAKIDIVKYNQTEGNTDKLDLVQEITMTVTYKLGNKEQKIEMKKTKQREDLVIPNKPDIKKIELQEGYYLYPIKKIKNVWKICSEKDDSWYDYESGNWALVLKTNKEHSIDEEIDRGNLLENEQIYAWIPRYAYDSSNNKIVFLFSNSNNYVQTVDGYSNIAPIDDNYYTVSNDFSNGQEQLIGVWANDSSLQSYKTLNSIYQLKD